MYMDACVPCRPPVIIPCPDISETTRNTNREGKESAVGSDETTAKQRQATTQHSKNLAYSRGTGGSGVQNREIADSATFAATIEGRGVTI